MKICTLCKIEKEFSEFRKQKKGRFGLTARCKSCEKIRHNEYRLSHLEHYAELQRLRRIKMQDMVNASDRIYRGRYHKSVDGYASKLLSGARGRSKKKRLECNLDSEWVRSKLSFLKCEVTGFDLTIENGGKYKTHPLQPTLDRIDSSKGYTKENVQVVCWWYNAMKQDWTDEMMVNLIKQYASNIRTREEGSKT